MDLNKLFPPSTFELNTDYPSGMKILQAAINQLHFERRKARNIGFRGLRVFHNLEMQGWTCKILNSELVFALVYLGELEDKTLIPLELSEAGKASSWSHFALLGFPEKDSELLETYPLDAISISSNEDYEARVRDFAFASYECMPFQLASLFLGVNCDNNKTIKGDASLTILLEAKELLRTIALDGFSYELDGVKEWLIMPNGEDSKIEAYKLIEPLFDTFVRTLGAVLADDEQKKTVNLHECDSYSIAYRNNGAIEYINNSSKLKYKSASFGKLLIKDEAFSANCEFDMQLEKEFRDDMPLIHIISGFLGSGKTTFLREWLSYLQNKDIYFGVIQNEFGQIPLDASLLKEDAVVEALDEGCVCCSLADALLPGVQRILEKMPNQDILLEASGVANPNNIVEALEDLNDIAKVGLVISVSDAKLLSEHLEFTENKLKLNPIQSAQIEFVDVVVLNKIDLVDETTLQNIKQAIQNKNKNCLILSSSFGRISFAMLDKIWDKLQLKKKNMQKSLLKPFNAHATHSDNSDKAYSSFTMYFNDKKQEKEIEELIINSNAVRAKGIVAMANGNFVVQHASSITNLTPTYFELDEKDNYLVFIGNELNREFLEKYSS